VGRFGLAAAGGVRYYAIDNEPDLWASTHTDVHPVQVGYDDMLSMFLDYAEAIKAVDPSARVVGPTLSGWTSLFNSARDQGSDNFRTHADRQAHGNMPFLPWWLDQVHQHDQRTGARSLDVLDVHYYPQAPNVYGAADDDVTRGLRLRSTRSLWDATYFDESWIDEPVRLVPRLREWIDQYYAGTQLAIGEWNWGGDQSLSGALAVADVLGIFGREGVDMATYWTVPPQHSLAEQAFAMYTNSDRHGHGFGDRAVSATVDASPNDVTAYASVDSATGDVVLIVLNKRDDADLPATIVMREGAGHAAEVFRLSATTVAPESVGPLVFEGSSLSAVLPRASITLLRIARD
jgi:hypothetical protein